MHTTGVINPSGTENSFDDDNQLADKTVSHSMLFFFSSRRRHTRFKCDWSSDVCSSDLPACPHLYEQFEDLDKQAHAARLGMWAFLASELLLFAGLLTLYASYRVMYPLDLDRKSVV